MTEADLQECLPHGTTVRIEDGRVVDVTAPGGQTIASVVWDDEGQLLAADLRSPTGSTIAIRRRGDHHPILGAVDQLWDATEHRRVAAFGQVDWAHPEWIPPLDRPGALPPGAGAAVLNLLAITARAADVTALRYRGPYPTAALFDALRSSFVLDEEPGGALARFVTNVETTAVEGRSVTPDVDFAPAPFEWSWPDARVCVQHRDGIERIYLDGHAFEAKRQGMRRLVADPEGGVEAIVAIDGQPWARVLSVDPKGRVVTPPVGLPAPPPELLGQALPQPVVAALLEIVADRAPPALATVLQRQAPTLRVTWGDPGLKLARATAEGIEIHAALVPALPTESASLLSTLLALVEVPLLVAAQRSLAEAHAALTERGG